MNKQQSTALQRVETELNPDDLSIADIGKEYGVNGHGLRILEIYSLDTDAELTQQEIANLAGCSVATVQQWNRDKRFAQAIAAVCHGVLNRHGVALMNKAVRRGLKGNEKMLDRALQSLGVFNQEDSPLTFKTEISIGESIQAKYSAKLQDFESRLQININKPETLSEDDPDVSISG